MNQNQTKKLSCFDKIKSYCFKKKPQNEQKQLNQEEQPQTQLRTNQAPETKLVVQQQITVIQQEIYEQFLNFIPQLRQQNWIEYFQNRKIFTIEKLVLAYQNSKTSNMGRKANEAENKLLQKIYEKFNTGVVTYNWEYIDANLIQIDFYNLQIFDSLKNVLVIGITGQGKSTFINSFYNNIQGFQFDQNIRYKVIKDQKDNQKAKSVTKKVQSYGMNVQDFIYNMIDTPGLADTDGPERDQEIIDNISEYITETLYKKNQSLHQVILVSQSSTDYIIKDTPTLNQLALLNVLKLFGKDMSQFYTHLLTFSDFSTANQNNFESQTSIFNALTTQYTIQEYTRQFSQLQQQSSLLPSPQILNPDTQNLLPNLNEMQKCYCQLQNSVYHTNNVGMIQKIQLRKNQENYNRLINKINESEGFTLNQTITVINERKNIREKINILNDELRVRIKIDKILQQNLKKLKLLQDKMDQTENFELTELRPYIRRVDSPVIVTNCSICQFSCHINCKVTTENLRYCTMMMEQQGEYNCVQCNHEVRHHTNEKYQYVKDFEVIIITLEDLRAEHLSAQQQHNNFLDYQNRQQEKEQENDLKIKILIGQLGNSFNQLYSSALYTLDLNGKSLQEFLYKYFKEYQKDKLLDKYFDQPIDLEATRRILNTIPLLQQTMVFRFQEQQ